VLKFKTVLSMGLSIWIYSFAWGWPFAIGFVLLIFVHEMGHVIAAKMLGMPVTAPLFIPFMGAAIFLKQHPRDAWTEALMAYGGPLAGALGSIAVWFVASQDHSILLMAVARAGFFLNLFNLIPLPPLDGGRICAAISPWFWITGLLLFGASFFFFQFSANTLVIGVIILFIALPRLKQTLFYPATPELQTYYATHVANRLTMALLYLGLIAVLLLGLWDANAHLSVMED
jgi:Zn-dependent protease